MHTELFHAGERALQERVGLRDKIEKMGRRMVRDRLTEDHRAFWAAQPFFVIAARDADGRPWASLLAGDVGFITSPDAQTLRIAAEPLFSDPLDAALGEGGGVGLLAIDFATRSRVRLNGTVTRRAPGVIDISVGQSFGNCPQFIHPREWRKTDAAPRAIAEADQMLDTRTRALVERADTMFVGTGFNGPSFGDAGMDVSHKGGSPGFLKIMDIESEEVIGFPDYAGNNMFNTLGNILEDKRAGLVIPDFETGELLQVTGSATVIFDDDVVTEFPGAKQVVFVKPERIVHTENALPITWDLLSYARELA